MVALRWRSRSKHNITMLPSLAQPWTKDMQREGRWPNLNKLLEGEFAVHVLVHLPEDLVSPLLRRRLILWHFHNRPNLEE